MKELTEETLSSFPEEILDVFKARLRRKFTGREHASIKNKEVLHILQRIKTLMENVELNFDEGRAGILETNSGFLRAALSMVKHKDYDS